MKKVWLLIAILILAAVLRLYNLSAAPAGLNADEAAQGYNAYSLLLTGRDEHGHSWPINFESFGDFKPAFYGYILIPFIKVFGLTELAVRLPAALAGILAVLVIYLLVKELFDEKLGYLSALLLAISPWHLHFSRGGWEVSLALTLILIGVWAFLKRSLVLSTFALVLSTYTYQTARIIVPLFVMAMVILNYHEVMQEKKKFMISAIIGLVLLLPLIYSFLFQGAASRIGGVGLLADEGPVNRVNELRGQYAKPDSLPVKLLHNKVFGYAWAFMENYTDQFRGDFLFITGDPIERNKVPETGLLYWSDLIFLIIGAVYLIKQSGSKVRLIWVWLVITPIAAALTFQTPHALRALPMVIPLTILTAAGINSLAKKINLQLLLLLLLLIYGWQVARYLHEYYVHYPQTYPAAWEYGFSEAVAYANANKDRYEHVYVTNKYDQPYILFLFYSHYPPVKFQFHHQLTMRDKYNFSTVNTFDKYVFTDTNWDKVSDIHPILIIAAAEDIPPVGVNVVKTINFPNGQPEFKIISN